MQTYAAVDLHLHSNNGVLAIIDETDEPFLEEMATAAMALAEALDVAAEKAMHAGRECALRSLDLEVVVVRHEAVLIENPAGADDLLSQKVEEELAVLVIPEDRDAVVAARHHMMEHTGILDSRLPRHRVTEATSASAWSRRSGPNRHSNLLGIEENEEKRTELSKARGEDREP